MKILTMKKVEIMNLQTSMYQTLQKMTCQILNYWQDAHYLYLNLLVFLESEVSQKKEYKMNSNRKAKNKMLIIWRHFIWLYGKFKIFYGLLVNKWAEQSSQMGNHYIEIIYIFILELANEKIQFYHLQCHKKANFWEQTP